MDNLLVQLQEIRRRATGLVAELTPEQLTRRPDPTRWSIAECLAHLNVTGGTYVPLLENAIQQGRENKILGKGAFKPGALGRLLKWIAEPPPKFRMRAPKTILPPSSITDSAKVIADFMRLQDDWERLVKDCDGLDQEKVKCKTPFPPLPALRLCAPIPWMLAHERRHLLQAEKVKQDIRTKTAGA
jgi:DinB superfamily